MWRCSKLKYILEEKRMILGLDQADSVLCFGNLLPISSLKILHRQSEFNHQMGNKSSKKHYKIPPNAAKPDAPGKPQAETQEDGVYLQWTHPKFDGNCPIIGYIVQHCELDEGTWYSSDPIPGNECLIHHLENGATYQFRVIAENLIGYSGPSQISEPVLFSTAFAHPRFLTKLKSISAIENEKIELFVQVTGRSKPRLKWYLNGEEITSGPNILIEGQTLTIKRATSDFEGEIMCSAFNEVGFESTVANLTVGAPPRITEDSSREIIFRVDELLRIKFTFTGRPKPEVIWLHNGTPLSEEKHNIETLATSTSLKISRANREHRGEYSIKIENNLGMDTGSVLVTVADRPSAPMTPTVVLLRDNSCLLEWEEGSDDGGSPVQCFIAEYFRTGWDVWLTGATSRSKVVKIPDLIPGSRYKFRIKAENLYGLSEPSKESIELLIPDVSSGLMSTVAEAEDETSENAQISNESKPDELNAPLKNENTLQSSIVLENKRKIPPSNESSSTTYTLTSKSPQIDSLLFGHYESRRESSGERKISLPRTSRNYSLESLNRPTRPWNKPQQTTNPELSPAPFSFSSKSLSLQRETDGKIIPMETKSCDGSPPRSHSSASHTSSHLIFECSSSEEEDEKSVITCSSLTVFKSGNCEIKTLSREELARSFDNVSKTTSQSRNSINSEDFEYYNSIFGKTQYQEDDEDPISESRVDEDKIQPTREDQSNPSENLGLSDDAESGEENSRLSWWYYLLIPISLCIFVKYTLLSNICVMLYVFYRLVMLFFE